MQGFRVPYLISGTPLLRVDDPDSTAGQPLQHQWECRTCSATLFLPCTNHEKKMEELLHPPTYPTRAAPLCCVPRSFTRAPCVQEYCRIKDTNLYNNAGSSSNAGSNQDGLAHQQAWAPVSNCGATVAEWGALHASCGSPSQSPHCHSEASTPPPKAALNLPSAV